MENNMLENTIEKHKQFMLDTYKQYKQNNPTENTGIEENYSSKIETSADENQTYEEFAEQNNKYGYLRVQVFTANQAIPIQGAKISISKKLKDGTKVFFRTSTDMNGIADNISLNAPEKKYSLEKTSDTMPYATYDVTATHPDYIQQSDFDCQIFEDIKSVQFLNMIPADVGENKQ